MFPLRYLPGRYFAPRYWPPRQAPSGGARPTVHRLFLSHFALENLTMAGAARIDVPLRLVDLSELRLRSEPLLELPLYCETTVDILLLPEKLLLLMLEE